jgi:hypothetical protein
MERTWQPIATAPHDGTEVLLYLSPYKRIVIAHFVSNNVHGHPVNAWLDNDDNYYDGAPILWQSLPELPEVTVTDVASSVEVPGIDMEYLYEIMRSVGNRLEIIMRSHEDCTGYDFWDVLDALLAGKLDYVVHVIPEAQDATDDTN